MIEVFATIFVVIAVILVVVASVGVVIAVFAKIKVQNLRFFFKSSKKVFFSCI